MNTIALGIVATMFGIIGGIFAQFSYLLTSIGFGVVSVILLFWSLFTHRKESKPKAASSSSGMLKSKIVVTQQDETRIVIKAICDESEGFKTINDIIRDTNLSLNLINKSIDWLLINNFASEKKLRGDKVYMLTPEGKSVFSRLINEYLHGKTIDKGEGQ